MVHKFALIGTSCAGKTSLAHSLVGRLKTYGVLADGIFSQDRKFSFPLSKIESEAAQNWMIANIIAKEADMQMHEDVELVLSDRSPLDLLAYYAYQYQGKSALYEAAKGYAIEWCKGYEALYYLEPLPYQDDHKRPSDEFRLGVDRVLLGLIDEAVAAGVNVVTGLARSDILRDVMQRAGIQKPSVKSALAPTDVQRLSNFLRLPVLAKFANDPGDPLSDTDMWIIISAKTPVSDFIRVSENHVGAATAFLRGHVGPWPLFDLMVTTDAAGLPDRCITFNPSQKSL